MREFLILFYKQLYRFYIRTLITTVMMRKFLPGILLVALGAVCCTPQNDLNPINPDASVFSYTEEFLSGKWTAIHKILN